MKTLLHFAATAVVMLAGFRATADEVHTAPIHFPKGKTHTVVSGKITGSDSFQYTPKARGGQFLKVSMETDKQSADFNIYIPGRGPGDEALFVSATGER